LVVAESSTFPLRPVISQKTSYKGTNAKENVNMPTTAKHNSFIVLLPPSFIK
jgi:hypothetical protein